MKISFNDKWLFHKGEIETEAPVLKGPCYTEAKTENMRRGPAALWYDDIPDDFIGIAPNHQLAHERWEYVTLPHDYVITQDFNPEANSAGGYFDLPAAWYRKHFKLEDAWKGKKIELEFDGVTTVSEIFVNGIYLKRNNTAFTPFTVDISDFVLFDGADNLVAVHVTTGMQECWWYAGGGITRKVWLKVSEPLHVARYGIHVLPNKIEENVWAVPTTVTLENYGFNGASGELTLTILDASEKAVASATASVDVAAKETKEYKFGFAVTDPLLWDVDDPNLYKIKAVLKNGEAVLDEASDTFGFRTIEFTPNDGFLLNGRRVPINGVCAHEDFAFTGRAVPENVLRYRIRLLKDMGANALRCSHYMVNKATMDACDRYGMMVMAETRHFSSSDEHISELKTLLLRDRNHPSVIMWSIGNEEFLFVEDRGRRIAERLVFEAKKLDSTRPLVLANDKEPDNCTVYDASDVIGINYNIEVFDTVHEKYPDKAVFASECAAVGGMRGWYYDKNNSVRSEYDEDGNSYFVSRETTAKHFHARPYVLGMFEWIGIDHRGECYAPRICSTSGSIDLFLQKKDAYYQNRSFWLKTPMIHVLPHWNMEGKTAGPVKVWAYTNCPNAELLLNGKSLGRISIEPCGHAEWLVPFEAGELKAIGLDENGCAVAMDVVRTTGKPCALALRLDNGDDLTANGEDLAIFTCYVVDENGNEVPDATPTVRFTSSRNSALVGTGSSIIDHNPVQLPTREMSAGKITVAVLPQKGAESFSLSAEAFGLTAHTIKVEL